MDANTNLSALVEEIHARRAKHLPEQEANNKRIEKLLAAIRSTREKADVVASHYPDLAAALQDVSFKESETKLLKAAKAVELALTRLKRPSINIGVAGKARQGKSQILQMLTGLNDQQIPTGDGGFCTAARSIVTNGKPQSAKVFYLTEADLLSQKVWPSYEPMGTSEVALGLSPKPVSLAAFLRSPLPPVSDTASVEALENWEKVKSLHADLKNHPELVDKLGRAADEVPIDTVRNYVVKDNNEKDYQVVDHVEITTQFEFGLPDHMTVYDLPGLEDPTPGIRETMLKSVSEDADIVLLLRMPKNTGDDWDRGDLNAMNMLKDVYPADLIQPKDWVQLVLNRDKRPASDNGNNIERMYNKAPSGFTPLICDCGSKDDVREKVVKNIKPLVDQAGNIDALRIRQADAAFKAALAEVNSLYRALRNASGDVLAKESGFQFDDRFDEFMGDLRDPFKRDRAPEFEEAVRGVLLDYFRKIKTDFAGIYEEYENAEEFPARLHVFTKKKLTTEFRKSRGPIEPVEKAVRNQREAIMELLRYHISQCCNDLVELYFGSVLSFGFEPNPALKRIGGDIGNSREWLKQFRGTLSRSGTFPTLDKALERLQGFQLTFDGSVLPTLYSTRELADFDPEHKIPDGEPSDLKDIENVIADSHDTAERTENLYDWLKQQSDMVLSSMTAEAPRKPFGQLVTLITNTMCANYNAFVFRFIWGDEVEREWKRYAERNKAIFWKDEFEQATANSRLAQEWNDALAGLAQELPQETL